MKFQESSFSLFKAASAALAFASVPALWAAGSSPDFLESPNVEMEQNFEEIKKSFHFRTSDTPAIIERFISDYSADNTVEKARLMLGDWYFFKGQYPLALKEYDRIPDNAFSRDTKENFLYRKAFSMIKSGFYDEASTRLLHIVKSKELGEEARFYLAYIDYVRGDYNKAYDSFKRLLSQGTKSPEAEYYINQIDYRKGDFNKVAETSERLLTSGTVPIELMAETLRVGGLSNFKTGEKEKARNYLEKYIDLAGDGAEISALYTLAVIYYDEGKADKALSLFCIVTEYPGPLAQSAWLYMGQIYLSEEDIQSAGLAFDKASKESWDNEVAERAAYNLALLSATGNSLPFSDSATIMENFILRYPSSPYSLNLSSYLANAYYNRRDFEKALAYIDKSDATDSRTQAVRQKILYQLGVSQLQEGDIKNAIQSLSKAVSAPDDHVGAQASLWLGDAYYAEGDYRAAVRAYEKALNSGKLGDNTDLASYNLGYALLKLGEYKKAQPRFKEVLSASGLNPSQRADARLRYADCLYYNGDYAKALSVFRDIRLEGGTDAAFAKIREADILGREGKIKEKISILETVVSDPLATVWRSVALSRLADAYSENGDDRKAASLYSEIIDGAGTDTDQQAYFSLASNAENLFRAGDYQAAYTAYKHLENSGIPAIYPAAVQGIMRTSSQNEEIAEYASKTSELPGISAGDVNEAVFLGAKAGLDLGGTRATEAKTALASLARSSDRTWGARAAVILGETLLREGDLKGAEELLLHLIDNGSDDNYWLARGYIALADVYRASDKEYLARLYLENLRDNYPGNEKDIRQMIQSRLSTH